MIARIDAQGRISLLNNAVKYMNLTRSHIAYFNISKDGIIHVKFSLEHDLFPLHSQLDERYRFILPAYFIKNGYFERNSQIKVTILSKNEIEISHLSNLTSCVFCGVKLKDCFFTFQNQKICLKCVKSFANALKENGYL